MENTFHPNDALNHPFSISHEFNTRNKLIKYFNQNGYSDRYGHTLQHRIFDRDLPHIMEFLDILQNEEQWTNWAGNIETEQTTQKPHDERQEQYDMINWMRNIETEQTTQKPHDERQEQYDMINWMKNIETEQTTQKPHDERKREYDRKNSPEEKYKNYLNTGFEKLTQYVQDITQHDVEWINLEPTSRFQHELYLPDIQSQLLNSVKSLLGLINADVAYVFEYQIVNENGDTQNRCIHLTPQNTQLIIDLLENRGLLITEDVEHFDPYEDENIPFPSWAIIKQFKIRRHIDRFGNEPTDRFRPKEYTGERKQWTPRGGNFFRWFASPKLPMKLLEQLKRYQIISRKEKGIKTILKDSCAIYAWYSKRNS